MATEPVNPQARLLTREEVAGALGVTVPIVRRLQETRKIKARKLGNRVMTTQRALDAYLAEQNDDYGTADAS